MSSRLARPLGLAFALVVGLLVTAAVLYVRNPTPVVPALTAAEAHANGQPWVVKLHAQWCPICMLTKGVWSQIARDYAGRVRFAVFDFTNAATTAASRAEAERLGLTALFDEAEFVTGPIIVLDGDTRAVRAWIRGSRDVDEYRAAIDAALHAEPGAAAH
jgi:thiol-disulfide isomerase/thioredoxin